MSAIFGIDCNIPQGHETTGPGDHQTGGLGSGFGAGSSDFTIYKAGNNQGHTAARERDILSVGGVYIGGDVFDSAIMREKVAIHYGKNVEAKSMWSDNLFGLSPLALQAGGRIGGRNWHPLVSCFCIHNNGLYWGGRRNGVDIKRCQGQAKP